MKVATGLRTALGGIALVFALAVSAFGEKSLGRSSAEDLLLILPTIKEGWLYDMHGNADEVIQQLMIQRFHATAAICQELDRSNLREGHIAALFDVLALVKDPAAIPWLEKQWNENPERMAEMWLGRRWHGHLRGASDSELKWLTGADKWAAFFRRRAAEETEPARRVQLLRVLAGWFHDEKTIEFFTDLEKASPGGETVLLSQVYLLQHKREFDSKRTAEGINELSGSAKNTELLLSYAEVLRHEAFVPWLVSVLDSKPRDAESSDPCCTDAQWVLDQITFCRGITGKEQWQKWLTAHGAEGRQAWITRAMAEFNQILKRNPIEAKAVLREYMHRWGDPALLPYVKEWLPYQLLHSELVGWINLSYHPYRRAELQKVGEQIITAGTKDLEDWALRRLKELGFLPGEEETWAEWVGGLNRAI